MATRHGRIIFEGLNRTRSGPEVSPGSSGKDLIFTTGEGDTGQISGNIYIYTGENSSGVSSGNLILETGEAENAISGSITIRTRSSSIGGGSGFISLTTQQSSFYNTGGIEITTGGVNNSFLVSGAIEIETGPGLPTGSSGFINLNTGDAGGFFTGFINLSTGSSTGFAGDISLTAGSGYSGGNPGNIFLSSGSSIGPSSGGNIILNAGYSSGSTGGIIQLVGGSSDGSDGGNILITGGSANFSSTGNGGDISLISGSCFNNNFTSTGNINILTANAIGFSNTVVSGFINITTGSTFSDITSGNLLLRTGFNFNSSGGNSGNLIIQTGNVSGISSFSGTIDISTGNGIAGNTGDVNISTGVANTKAGDIFLTGGTTISGNFPSHSGNIAITGGPSNSPLVDGGFVSIAGGSATQSAGGQISITGGSSNNFFGGNVVISGGASSATTPSINSGDVRIFSGFCNFSSTAGNIIITARDGGPSGGNGGNVIISAGRNRAALFNPGDVTIQTQDPDPLTPNANGGNIQIIAADRTGTGIAGEIQIRTARGRPVSLRTRTAGQPTGLRFFDAASANPTNFVEFRSPNVLPSSQTYILPSSAPPLEGSSLVAESGNVLTWVNAGYCSNALGRQLYFRSVGAITTAPGTYNIFTFSNSTFTIRVTLSEIKVLLSRQFNTNDYRVDLIRATITWSGTSPTLRNFTTDYSNSSTSFSGTTIDLILSGGSIVVRINTNVTFSFAYSCFVTVNDVPGI
ncbi:MAG: hypothetical protein NZZ41_02180 [Candidatus Dojkabacteria bacterium]|nr:hypothetical protein [Candidatus Dojkabacteria bacterium]